MTEQDQYKIIAFQAIKIAKLIPATYPYRSGRKSKPVKRGLEAETGEIESSVSS